MARNFFDALAEWEQCRDALETLKEKESALRLALFGAAFPNPREGTNTYKLPNNKILKGQYGYSRKVLPGKLAEVDSMLETSGSNSRSRDFLKWTPSLREGLYKQAPAEVRNVLDRAIETKLSKPALFVEEVKDES